MEQVIYTSSVLSMFGQTIVVIAFLMGVAAFALNSVRRNRQRFPLLMRVWLGFGAVATLGSALLLGYISLADLLDGPNRETVKAGDKQIVTTRGPKGGTTTDYLIVDDHPAARTFAVSKSAYDLIVPGNCYRFTYYAAWSDPIRQISEIRLLDPQQCGAGGGVLPDLLKDKG